MYFIQNERLSSTYLYTSSQSQDYFPQRSSFVLSFFYIPLCLGNVEYVFTYSVL